MKIIEAMKQVARNKDKISDLQLKIQQNSAHLSHETSPYGTDVAAKITEWAQSCEDLVQENIRLLIAIQRTNLATKVKLELGGKQVEKSIAEWVWRRREYALIDQNTWSKMTDRNLREGKVDTSTGVAIEVRIVRNYDPNRRDKKLAEYQDEPKLINSTLEVINATTDLVEK
jgi:hypothetical protein